jgi:hypothetical protein
MHNLFRLSTIFYFSRVHSDFVWFSEYIVIASLSTIKLIFLFWRSNRIFGYYLDYDIQFQFKINYSIKRTNEQWSGTLQLVVEAISAFRRTLQLLYSP